MHSIHFVEISEIIIGEMKTFIIGKVTGKTFSFFFFFSLSLMPFRFLLPRFAMSSFLRDAQRRVEQEVIECTKDLPLLLPFDLILMHPSQ